MAKSAFCLSIIGVITLTACGGGSSSSSSSSIDNLADPGLALAEQLSSMPATAALDMPVSGSALYEGYAAYSVETSNPAQILSDPGTVSEIEIRADFASSIISGNATNFQNYDGVQMEGSLGITNGSVVGATLSADIGGTLTENGVPIRYDGEIQGGFLGQNAEAIAGTGFADASVAGTYVGTAYAVFGAER